MLLPILQCRGAFRGKLPANIAMFTYGVAASSTGSPKEGVHICPVARLPCMRGCGTLPVAFKSAVLLNNV